MEDKKLFTCKSTTRDDNNMLQVGNMPVDDSNTSQVQDLGDDDTVQLDGLAVNDGMTTQMRISNTQAQATEYWEKFQEFGNIRDLNMTISLEKEIVNLVSDNDPDKPGYLNSLGISLRRRFERFDQVADIAQAISVQEQAVDLTPDGHPDKPSRLNNLGNSFESRFRRFGKMEDIARAISVQEQVIKFTPDDHPNKAGRLTNLGNSFQSRFGRFGEVADLDQSILMKQQAVNLTPDGHPHKAGYLYNLGVSLWSRFARFGQVADIDQSILVQQRAVDLTLDSHPGKPSFLSSLGNSFQDRFERFGQEADIAQSILFQQQAVDLTPNDYIDKPCYLNNLALAFLSRFERFDRVIDINKTILNQEQAVNLTPDDHPDKPSRLSNLGNSFQSRFERFGEVADIDKSILVQQRAIDLILDRHPHKHSYLNNLGNSFQIRYGRFGELADLNHSISAQQQALELTPPNHPKKSRRLNNLGLAFRSRFERFHQVTDIDQSILAQQQAVNLTPDGHPSKPGYLNNLGSSFHSRFIQLDKVSDIDEAISMRQRAIKSFNIAPGAHADKPSCLNNLGVSLQSRFKRLGQVADIEQSITIHREAVDLTPDGHAIKSGYLDNLGRSLQTRFEQTSDSKYLLDAISSFVASACSTAGSPRYRLNAARHWAILAYHSPLSASHPSPLQACRVLMELVPRVVWFGNSISLRYQDIASIGNDVNMAASIACSFGYPDLAFEWLEQGRSIVWTQMLHLRTPLNDLKDKHPELAASMETLSHRLERLSIDINQSTTDNPNVYNYQGTSPEQAAQEHRRLAEEWEKLLTRIRQCTGFEKFLQPKAFADLVPAAKNGPVVFVNIEEYRCDALILQNSKNLPQLNHVPLSLASLKMIKKAYGLFAQHLDSNGYKSRDSGLQHNDPDLTNDVGEDASDRFCILAPLPGMGMEDLLEMLWITIVEPVIQKLGYTENNDTENELPHVTWCTTGPLAFLPLHAAGHYGTGMQATRDRVYNYIVSSYTPSISALIKYEDMGPYLFHGLTAISQPSTTNLSLGSLPGTVDEVKKVQDLFKLLDDLKAFTWLNGPQSTKERVLERMKASSWLHLACHGVQRKENPMKSAFAFYDGNLDLHTISQQNLSNARLAFLSACQTATGDENLPNEAAHLAAGMLMIGYHSVIGTMWSIKDRDAPLVAEEFYRYLFTRNMKTDRGETAQALHKAIEKLRDSIGVMEFARWVPFIHLGI